MAQIRERLASQPEIMTTWFVYDEIKAGGSYVTAWGNVKRLDLTAGAMLLTDGTMIPIAEIIRLQLTGDRGKL